ncbi:MAG: hypothetical protein U0521_08185 [Anaerolineae bacterium]
MSSAHVRRRRADAWRACSDNGPGDPASPTSMIDGTKALLGQVPIFGICRRHPELRRWRWAARPRDALRASRRQPACQEFVDGRDRDRLAQSRLRVHNSGLHGAEVTARQPERPHS